MDKKKYRKILIGMIMVGSLFTYVYTVGWLNQSLPDTITTIKGENVDFHMELPVAFTMTSSSQEVSFVGESDIPSDSIRITHNNEVAMHASEEGKYEVSFKAFGLFPIKTVDVEVVESQTVKVVGQPIGMYMKTRGVLVVGTGKVADKNGVTKEPALGKVVSGDYITSFNDIPISNKAQLIYLVKQNGKKDVVLGIDRNGNEVKVKVTPFLTAGNEYVLGIWVRDDTQGIGTLTYIKQDGTYAALGHGVRDVDTQELLDCSSGSLYRAKIWGIEKGKAGDPGGLCGYIQYDENNILGTIACNTACGIFGNWESSELDEVEGQWMETACAQEIQKGKAYIRCNLDGETKDYEIKITQIQYSDKNTTQNMVIEVTDKKLLNLTNGIVQGMSGSPIIQNGKLIGAVTHVFVKDSAKGYGIFIENMLEN